MNRDYDIRSLLPSIAAPTLVIHLEDNLMIPPRFGRYIAEQIPGARWPSFPVSTRCSCATTPTTSSTSWSPSSPVPQRLRRPHNDHHPLHRHRRLDSAGGFAGRRPLECGHRPAQRPRRAGSCRPRGATRSSALETVSWLPSMTVRPPCAVRCAAIESVAGLGLQLARRRARRRSVHGWAVTTFRASPCTSHSGSAREPKEASCSPPAPCAGLAQGRAFGSPTAA